MWNKPKDENANAQQPDPIRGSAPPPGAAQAPIPAPGIRGPAPTAVIGPSMHVKGEIRSCEELLVDGDVEGLLESESLLTVSANGKVRANIKAREVVIFGSVRGDVEVTGKIAIRDQGSLIGDIQCAGISIDDGAYFKGSIDIVRPNPKTAEKPAPPTPKIAVPVS